MKRLLLIGIASLALGAPQSDQQSSAVGKPTRESWAPLDPPDSAHSQLCHRDFLRLWRLITTYPDHGHGNWHLYNPEDDRKFVEEVATGKWPAYRIEWFAVPMDAPLPK